MGVTHFLNIRNQSIRKLGVAQVSVVLLRKSGPRSEMKLIHTDRLLRPIGRFPFLRPGGILPGKTIQIENQRSGLHSMLAEKGKGIAFQDNLAKTITDLVFVMSPFTNAGNEDFPDPGLDPFSHRMAAAIPSVKIADHTHPLSIGSPNGKTHS